MTNLINKKIEEFEKRYENSKEQFRGKMSSQDKAFVKAFLHQALTQQLDELKGKVEGVRVESARTCSSEDTDEYRAYDAGEEAMRNKILTLIDSMK